MKLKTLQTTFFSLILIICIISYIAYSFPDLFQICFHLSNFVALFLSINFLRIIFFHNPNPQLYYLKTRFLIANVIAIVISVIWLGIIGYFLWHYPLSSFTEPSDCFIIIWGIATLTFSAFTLIFLIYIRILKKIKYHD